ncbi:MAG: methyltransferase domain-containing protein [Bryobacteraceae bacterium]
MSSRIERWNQRYQAGEQGAKSPPRLVVDFAGSVAPGCALDLACGPGRNALYLAELGWRVTALDASPVAIDLLLARAHPRIDARLVDLEATGLEIAPGTFDLVLSSYYFQRSLIPVMKSVLRSGGLLIMIVLLDPPPGTPTRAYPGELRALFDGWRILHNREGELGEPGDRQAVAELVARQPAE